MEMAGLPCRQLSYCLAASVLATAGLSGTAGFLTEDVCKLSAPWRRSSTARYGEAPKAPDVWSVSEDVGSPSGDDQLKLVGEVPRAKAIAEQSVGKQNTYKFLSTHRSQLTRRLKHLGHVFAFSSFAVLNYFCCSTCLHCKHLVYK